MNRWLETGTAVAALTLVLSVPAGAANLMPSFAGAPTGWTVDRYAPDSFADIGTINGRTTCKDRHRTAANTTPVAYPSSFYNTQGMSPGRRGRRRISLSAYLYVPADWANAARFQRTDE